jgi:hypothetical protein
MARKQLPPIVDDDGFPDDLHEALNDGKPKIISAFGRAGSGKSVAMRRLYQSWPGDKLCLDVNGNAEPGADAERIARADLSKRWPIKRDDATGQPRPRNLHYRADPGSATYVDDLDRAVGMALFPQDHPVLLWAGEVGELMPNAVAQPNMRRVLQQNRHHKITALFDGPRPVGVHPLVLAQSRFVFVYNVPNPSDRRRIADSIGYDPAAFDAVHNECQRLNGQELKRPDGSPHWYLLWHQLAHQLFIMAPLPVEPEQKTTAA